MTPNTPAELYSALFRGAVARLHVNLTAAARRGPLTEEDIARIERDAIEHALGNADAYAAEFPSFNAREVARGVRDEFEQLLRAIRTARVDQLSKMQ